MVAASGQPVMESSELKDNSSAQQHRRTKFTPENIRQITNLVERGTSPDQIAEIIGVTLGTLRATCSKLHISLRRPSYDTGTGLIRHRRPRAAIGGSPYNVDAPKPLPIGGLERHPMEQEPIVAHRDKTSTAPLATFAIVMQYKGQKHAADLHLGADMIGRLAIEAEFRGMKFVELLARAIEAIAEDDHFHLLLGSPKRAEDE
jgi:hypothetical protein